MQVTVKQLPETSQVELEVTVSSEEFSPYLERAAKTLSKDAPPSGFRPGKVPLDVALDTYGQERVLRTAMDKALPHFFVQAVLDHDVQAINRPNIAVQELGVGRPLRFTATVDVIPEVTLGDVSSFTAERRAVDVPDEEVDQELQRLAKMRSTYLEVARPAQDGDTVTIDFRIMLNGQVIEGGESKNHPVHLGEGYFIPGFEQQLRGVSTGDERTFRFTFPDDYGREQLRGKEVEAWVKVHSVQKRVIPELTDAFAKQVGSFTDLAHLKRELKQGITNEKEQRERERFQASLNEQLAATATFGALPPVLIEKEIDRRIGELQQMLSLQQKTVADYLATQNKTVEQMRDDMRSSAEQGVKMALALRAFATREQISVSDDEIDERVAEYLKRFPSESDAQKSIDPQELRDHVTGVLRNQKALERLEELVAGPPSSTPS